MNMRNEKVEENKKDKKYFDSWKDAVSVIIITLIIVVFAFLVGEKDNITLPLLNDEDENYIQYTCTIDKLYVNDDKAYFVDVDKHVFVTDFDPEYLLLDQGDNIKVTFNDKYEDNNVINISDIQIWGVVK